MLHASHDLLRDPSSSEPSCGPPAESRPITCSLPPALVRPCPPSLASNTRSRATVSSSCPSCPGASSSSVRRALGWSCGFWPERQTPALAGAGYVAVELAGIFASLGARTSLAIRRPGGLPLAGFDSMLQEELRKGARSLCACALGGSPVRAGVPPPLSAQPSSRAASRFTPGSPSAPSVRTRRRRSSSSRGGRGSRSSGRLTSCSVRLAGRPSERRAAGRAGCARRGVTPFPAPSSSSAASPASDSRPPA